MAEIPTEVGQVKHAGLKLIVFSSILAAISGLSLHVAASYIAPAFANRQWLVWSTVVIVFILSLIVRWKTYVSGKESHIKDASGFAKPQTRGVNISSSVLHSSKVAGRDIVEGKADQRKKDISQNE